MSIQAVDWAFKQKMKLAGMKLVLVAIANYADEQGTCWPSQTSLASITSMTDRAVRSNVVRLEKAGFLIRDRHQGRYGNDLYTLQFHRNSIPEDGTLIPLEESSTGTGFQSEPEVNSENHRNLIPPIHQKKTVNLTVRKKKRAPEDPRRSPFVEFCFESWKAKRGDLITDGSDFKALKTLLDASRDKPLFALEKLQEYWTRFLNSPDDYHQSQGKPLRFFCMNINAFVRNENGNGKGHEFIPGTLSETPDWLRDDARTEDRRRTAERVRLIAERSRGAAG